SVHYAPRPSKPEGTSTTTHRPSPRKSPSSSTVSIPNRGTKGNVLSQDEELADDTSPRGRSARIVSREITRLADLVEDLLEMTQQDAGVGAVTVTDTDIADLVAAALEQRGWHRVAVTGGPAHARTDPRRLGAVVTNLVGNALRHGAEPVTVDIGADDQTVTIAV